MGGRARAVAVYEKALELNPDGSEALSKLGFIFLNRGSNKKAAEYAARAVENDPTSSEGWIVLGAARHVLNDYEGAREAYRRCVEQGKGDYVIECRRMLR